MPLSIGAISYVLLLFINAIAVLSHDRFLAPLGLSRQQDNVYSNTAAAYGNGFESYGNTNNITEDGPGVKQRAIDLVAAVRTLMRSQSRPRPLSIVLPFPSSLPHHAR